MTDLFDYRYPDTAGQKGGGASAIAAAAITDSGVKGRLERMVMDLFVIKPRWTPDEAAQYLQMHPSDIRPRFSELSAVRRNARGEATRNALLRKTDDLRKSGRGKPQHVYELIGSSECAITAGPNPRR